MDNRLAEAKLMARRGDPGGSRAAVDAYDDTLADAVRAVGSERQTAAALVHELQRERTVLGELLLEVPSPVREQVLGALEHTDRAVLRLRLRPLHGGAEWRG